MSFIFLGLHKSGLATHHISPCGPCLCCSLHLVLSGQWCQRYICRPHPRGHGVTDLSVYFSLVLLTAMVIPTSNHTEQSVLMASTGFVSSTTTLTLRLTDPCIFPPKGLFTRFQWVWRRRINLQAKDGQKYNMPGNKKTILFLVVCFSGTFSFLLWF